MSDDREQQEDRARTGAVGASIDIPGGNAMVCAVSPSLTTMLARLSPEQRQWTEELVRDRGEAWVRANWQSLLAAAEYIDSL